MDITVGLITISLRIITTLTGFYRPSPPSSLEFTSFHRHSMEYGGIRSESPLKPS
jgi:hypothetical protein